MKLIDGKPHFEPGDEQVITVRFTVRNDMGECVPVEAVTQALALSFNQHICGARLFGKYSAFVHVTEFVFGRGK